MPLAQQAPMLRNAVPISTPDLFREEYLTHHHVLPLERTNDGVRVLVAGSPPEDVLADMVSLFGAPLVTEQVSEEEVETAIRRAFAAQQSVVELVRELGSDVDGESGGSGGTTDVRSLANQPPVVRYVNLLIREAHDAGASDVHLDATREGLRSRLRIDGVLSELPPPPPALQSAIVSRLKLLAELDIAERRVPQDGRIRVRLESRELDLRVATVPTLHGESLVLRLLDRGGRPVELAELGMPMEEEAALDRLFRRTSGIVLATGPTGSGKTTTLYAALGRRDRDREKLMTIEDPIEYHVTGVTQVQVSTKAGVTFATALRSLLRHDPDVLLVGEMRDRETASIAVQAAMTGHLVLSTLHTTDAVSALVRLVDLGVEPYLVAATVEAVIAQRLVRRTCAECQVRYSPDPASVALLSGRPETPRQLVRGTGCNACRQSGFRGRVAIFEILRMSDDLRAALQRSPDVVTLRRIAQQEGLVELARDGWRKVEAGLTTVEEVLRVLGA